ncbi:MAG: hypothetical protein KAX37_01190 [Opitutaceae bacterium]|jgi:hypothetical protein|nr:hypothetical protein [Opitutaceae bacterium]
MTSTLSAIRRLVSALGLTGILLSAVHAQQAPQSRDESASHDDRTSRRDRRSNFSMDEMRQRMSAALKEQFKVSNDEEWALINERITKVQDLRRSTMPIGSFMGRFMGGSSGGEGSSSRFRGSMPQGMSNPEVDALSAAIRNNATAADLKARLERLREVRKQNEVKLAAAQEELRAVLDVRQEAIAVLMGLLP